MACYACTAFTLLIRHFTLLLCSPLALLTLAKWTSLSDVLGRKFLLHIGMFGITVSFLLNWFAASRFNFFGYHIYYVEAVLLGLIPVGALLNPAVFSYTGKASASSKHDIGLIW